MSNETIPLNLFKANLELQLRLQRLMQENGQQWLENATRAGKDGIAESGTEIESLLKAQNWQELATLPAQAFWRPRAWSPRGWLLPGRNATGHWCFSHGA